MAGKFILAGQFYSFPKQGNIYTIYPPKSSLLPLSDTIIHRKSKVGRSLSFALKGNTKTKSHNVGHKKQLRALLKRAKTL
jgi:hypothetical protein